MTDEEFDQYRGEFWFTEVQPSPFAPRVASESRNERRVLTSAPLPARGWWLVVHLTFSSVIRLWLGLVIMPAVRSITVAALNGAISRHANELAASGHLVA